MPEYLAPGVYIEEISGPEPIEGVSTSVTGIVGVTQRGPLDTLPPILVTSIPEFQRIFGSYFTPGFGTAGYNFLPHAVAGFFNNGGKLLYIKRVASAAGPPQFAVVAGLENNLVAPLAIQTRLASTANPGDATLRLAGLRGIQNNATLVLRQVKDGLTTTSTALTVQSYDDATNTVTLTVPLPAPPAPVANYEAQYTTVAVTAGGAFTPAANAANFGLRAADPGVWANTVQIQETGIELQVRPSRARARARVQAIGSVAPGVNNLVLLNSAINFYSGAIVEFNTTTVNAALPQKFYSKVLNVTANGVQLTAGLTAAHVAAINANLGAAIPVWIGSCEFDLVASYDGVSESFRGLTLDNTTPYFYATEIENRSTLLTVPQPFPSDQATTDPSTMPIAADGLNLTLSGGTDGTTPVVNDFVGNNGGPGNRTGIQALIDAREISIIAAPGITDQTVQMALIEQCETLRYRFAILDPVPTTNVTRFMDDIRQQRNLYDTKYAALYFPSLVISDPLTGNDLTIPPSGHMAGIYAQVSSFRGVWKAPANIVINGVNEFQIKLSKGEQDVLNPEPVNICVLRDFRDQGRGLRVYGARCITSEQEWKYINVRRLFIFLEASLDLGTQWAVFEPNDERLWKRLIQSVSNFLTTVWREGGLMGSKPEEAYFVKCGRETMSQDDIENGRLIMVVGVAPVFPAEFVIIRIGQWAGGSSVQEL